MVTSFFKQPEKKNHVTEIKQYLKFFKNKLNKHYK